MLFQAYPIVISVRVDVRVSGGWCFCPSRPASPFIASEIVAGDCPSFPPESGISFRRHVLPFVSLLVAGVSACHLLCLSVVGVRLFCSYCTLAWCLVLFQAYLACWFSRLHLLQGCRRLLLVFIPSSLLRLLVVGGRLC